MRGVNLVKFTVNLEDLKRVINAVIASFDANIDDNLKQVIFSVNKDEQYIDVAAYSYLLSFYTRIEADVQEGGLFTVGLKLSEIVNVCASHGSNTHIDSVTFTEEEKFVFVEALEYGKEGSLLAEYSESLKWALPKTLSKRVLKHLNFSLLDADMGDDVAELDINNLKFILDTFTPLLVKGELKQPSAYLYFSKDYIYCVNGSNVSYCDNMFSNLAGMNLNSKVLSYLRVLLNESNDMSSLYLFYASDKIIIKFDDYIIVYNLAKMPQFNIDRYLEDRQDAIVISMEMLLNIINRSTISDNSIVFDIKEDNLNIRNKKVSSLSTVKFNTNLPILKKTCDDKTFIVDLDILSKAILQKKGKYAIIYIYQVNGVNRVKITDEAKTWFSDIPVEIER